MTTTSKLFNNLSVLLALCLCVTLSGCGGGAGDGARTGGGGTPIDPKQAVINVFKELTAIAEAGGTNIGLNEIKEANPNWDFGDPVPPELLERAQKNAERIKAIDTSACPDEFRVAFSNLINPDYDPDIHGAARFWKLLEEVLYSLGFTEADLEDKGNIINSLF